MNPQAIIADIAETEIGVREVTRNQAPAIEKYWTATSYADGMANREPWCSAFVAWCVQTARVCDGILRVGRRPDFAAVRQWVPWAVENGGMILRPEKAKRGDIVVFTFSHIGIVTGIDAGVLWTVEGNTNEAGMREGDGVYRRRRGHDSVSAVIRLPLRAVEA